MRLTISRYVLDTFLLATAAILGGGLIFKGCESKNMHETQQLYIEKQSKCSNYTQEVPSLAAPGSANVLSDKMSL